MSGYQEVFVTDTTCDVL